MGTGKVEKVTAFVIALLVTVLSFLQVADWHSVGIYSHCHLSARLAYPFFHANLFHALLNAWCLLSMVFIYKVSLLRMLFAYTVAVTMPVDTLGAFLPFNNPTVGLSGVVYVLFGTISFEVARKRYFQCWMLFYIAVGFFFPNTNAWLHLYCYLFGFIAALLNKPINRKT
jgi:membrane associated rhomboid family serine protease